MKTLIALTIGAVVVTLCCGRANADLPLAAKEPARGVGNWAEDIGDHKPHTRGDGTTILSMGNHRAWVMVSDKVDAVSAHIPWRRREENPDHKATVVVDAATGKEIANVVRVAINREFGDIVFQPTSGPGDYYVYYMPYSYLFYEGSGDYRVSYTPPQDTADAAWVQQNGLAKEHCHASN